MPGKPRRSQVSHSQVHPTVTDILINFYNERLVWFPAVLKAVLKTKNSDRFWKIFRPSEVSNIEHGRLTNVSQMHLKFLVFFVFCVFFSPFCHNTDFLFILFQNFLSQGWAQSRVMRTLVRQSVGRELTIASILVGLHLKALDWIYWRMQLLRSYIFFAPLPYTISYSSWIWLFIRQSVAMRPQPPS